MSRPEPLSPFEQWHHDTKWCKLQLLLANEYELHLTRVLIERARVPSKGIRLSPDLVRLMKLKEINQ